MDTIKIWIIWFWSFYITPLFLHPTANFFYGSVKVEYLKSEEKNTLWFFLRDPGVYTLSYLDPNSYTGANDPIILETLSTLDPKIALYELQDLPHWLTIIVTKDQKVESQDIRA